LIASTFNDETPDYSPDGKKIAFASSRTGVNEIYVARVDGSEPRQVTFLGRPHTSNPRWSPDGRVIVFDSRRTASADLFLISPEDGSLQQLTDHPADEVEPRWSRDGKWIYFGSNRTGQWEVYRIARTGGAFIQVTHHGGVAATETLDRKWLYYARNTSTPTSIWKVPVSGGEETKVLDGLSYSLNFVTIESGIYYLALGDTPRQTSIRFFDFANSKTRPMLELGTHWWYGMAISPDQRPLVYSVVDSAGSNLMLVDGVR
jgi:dipeptidyl aminopeptidase/acylaminoacyl peptidase